MAERIVHKLRPKPAAQVGADGIVLLEDLGAAYIAIPKAANSTVKAVCAKLLLHRMGDLYQDRWPPEPFRTPGGQARLRDLGILVGVDALDGRDVFTVTRHPLDRLVSCWSSKIDSDYHDANGLPDGFRKLGFEVRMPFPDFVRRVAQIDDADADLHFRSQAAFFIGRSGRNYVTSMLRFEDLPACLTRYLTALGAADVDVPHLLKSNRQSWQDYYDADTDRMARRRYAWDMEVCGYR